MMVLSFQSFFDVVRQCRWWCCMRRLVKGEEAGWESEEEKACDPRTPTSMPNKIERYWIIFSFEFLLIFDFLPAIFFGFSVLFSFLFSFPFFLFSFSFSFLFCSLSLSWSDERYMRLSKVVKETCRSASADVVRRCVSTLFERNRKGRGTKHVV